MERLTERNNGANRINCDNCGAKGNCKIPNTCICEITNRLAAYEDAEEHGYIITPPDLGLKVYIIDKNGDIIKSNISKTSNIKDFFFDYAISIDNTTM